MNIIIKKGKTKYCPDCFSENLIHDFHHAQIYCANCGLVVMEQVYPSLDYVNYTDLREIELTKHLKEQGIELSENNYTLKDLLNDIEKEIELNKQKKKKK